MSDEAVGNLLGLNDDELNSLGLNDDNTSLFFADDLSFLYNPGAGLPDLTDDTVDPGDFSDDTTDLPDLTDDIVDTNDDISTALVEALENLYGLDAGKIESLGINDQDFTVIEAFLTF